MDGSGTTFFNEMDEDEVKEMNHFHANEPPKFQMNEHTSNKQFNPIHFSPQISFQLVERLPRTKPKPNPIIK